MEGETSITRKVNNYVFEGRFYENINSNYVNLTTDKDGKKLEQPIRIFESITHEEFLEFTDQELIESLEY